MQQQYSERCIIAMETSRQLSILFAHFLVVFNFFSLSGHTVVLSMVRYPELSRRTRAANSPHWV